MLKDTHMHTIMCNYYVLQQITDVQYLYIKQYRVEIHLDIEYTSSRTYLFENHFSCYYILKLT